MSTPVGAAYVRAVYDSGEFAVTCSGGVTVGLLDLDPETIAELARLCGRSWVDLVETPTADLAGALGLVYAAERAAGVEHDPPESIAELLGRFVRHEAREPRSQPLYAAVSPGDDGPGTRVAGNTHAAVGAP
jgi:hypothetical protein